MNEGRWHCSFSQFDIALYSAKPKMLRWKILLKQLNENKITRLDLRHTCITLFISIAIKYTGDVQGDFLISFGFSHFSPFLHSTRLAVIYMNVNIMIKSLMNTSCRHTKSGWVCATWSAVYRDRSCRYGMRDVRPVLKDIKLTTPCPGVTKQRKITPESQYISTVMMFNLVQVQQSHEITITNHSLCT